jgi:hypothetical protein
MNNPFCFPSQCTPQPFTLTSTRNTSSSFPFTLIFLVLGVVMLLSLTMASNCVFAMDATNEELFEHKIKNTEVIHRTLVENVQKPKQEYKTYTAPKNGTVKLCKGEFVQTHHNIKEDSVILLSRKTIDGKAGNFLTIDKIDPNKKFRIAATDELGDIEVSDCGEIYFQIL